MRLFLLTALTMTAFAANSVLNRAALAGGGIGAAEFATIRLIAGAAMLGLLALALRRGMSLGGPGRVAGVLGLLVYVYGFSVAYLSLDAGLGALILFGTVQLTMFAASVIGGERPPALRWLGAAMALGGLAWLLWPQEVVRFSALHAMAMALAGVGWGVYSIAGRQARDPLVATAANFLLAVPVGTVLSQAFTTAAPLPGTGSTGLLLAVVSGAITSGLGYALWYRVLPDLPGTVAAVAQLTVPVIAMLGGALLLGEMPGAAAVGAGLVVLAGVAVSVLRG